RGVGAGAGGGAAAVRGRDEVGHAPLPEHGQAAGRGARGRRRGGGMRPERDSAPATSYCRTGTACGLPAGLPWRKVRERLDTTIGAVDHVAIVDHPRDKGCRWTKVKRDGYLYCTLTLRQLEKAGDDRGNVEVCVLRAR